MEVAAPRSAARRTGEPREPSNASTPAAPAVAAVTATQAELVGCACPPVGSDMATKSASDPQVMAAAHQVVPRICWWTHSRRSTSAKTSSVTSSGCTTDIWPLCSARAWKTKDPARATQPSSQSGLDTR